MANQKTKNKTTLVPEIATLEAQIHDLEEKLARSLADYSNLQKRHTEQHQMFATLAITAFISQMVAVLDDLHLAYQHLPDPGLKMAIDRFVSVLKDQGLTEIDALHQDFDPNTMECLQVVPGQENQVMEIKKPGYLINGQCLRPAQVTVGKKLDTK